MNPQPSTTRAASESSAADTQMDEELERMKRNCVFKSRLDMTKARSVFGVELRSRLLAINGFRSSEIDNQFTG